MTLLTALVLALSQQAQTAQRTEKGDYYPLVQKCKEAQAAIETDPRTAVEKFDEIINNPKVRRIECWLRIEEKPSEYTDWYAFLPFQYRGRAKIALARKSEPEAAQKLLTEAVADLQRSIKEGVTEGSLKEGVKASDEFLKVAKADLEAVQAKIKAAAASAKSTEPAVEPAIVKFRPAFQRLLDDSRFKSALAFVDSDGKGLTDAEKKRFKDDAAAASAASVDDQVARLRRKLDVGSLKDLQALSARELESMFAVPKTDELVASHPALDWARSSLAAFEGVRSKKSPAESLLPVAAAAVRIDPDGENLWFSRTEVVAFEGMRDAAQACAARARDALGPDREKERAAADGLVRQWTDFAAKLDPKFRAAHPAVADHGKELAQVPLAFPVDLAELDKADLDACFAAASPEAAFAQVEQSLKGLEAGKTVARESRRRLYHLLFTAAALRALCEGKSEEDAADKASAYGQRLVELGGALETKKYGPRMEKVFSKLR